MTANNSPVGGHPIPGEWVAFPGGELEGLRPRPRCPACRQLPPDRASHSSAAVEPGRPGTLEPSSAAVTGRTRPLCFQCYRLALTHERALKAAAEFTGASDERFHLARPFEPVNASRLTTLKIARERARAAAKEGPGACIERRRQGQIAARHALARLAEGLGTVSVGHGPGGRATHESAADVRASATQFQKSFQFPESWLPFVVSR